METVDSGYIDDGQDHLQCMGAIKSVRPTCVVDCEDVLLILGEAAARGGKGDVLCFESVLATKFLVNKWMQSLSHDNRHPAQKVPTAKTECEVLDRLHGWLWLNEYLQGLGNSLE